MSALTPIVRALRFHGTEARLPDETNHLERQKKSKFIGRGTACMQAIFHKIRP